MSTQFSVEMEWFEREIERVVTACSKGKHFWRAFVAYNAANVSIILFEKMTGERFSRIRLPGSLKAVP
jgi:hypothetical protein